MAEFSHSWFEHSVRGSVVESGSRDVQAQRLAFIAPIHLQFPLPLLQRVECLFHGVKQLAATYGAGEGGGVRFSKGRLTRPETRHKVLRNTFFRRQREGVTDLRNDRPS